MLEKSPVARLGEFTRRRPFIAPDFWSMAYKHMHEQPTPLTQLNKNIPVYIEQAVLKAMAKERTDRYPNVATFIVALQFTKEQWRKEGNTFFEKKRYEEAVLAYEQAIGLAPNIAVAHKNRGDVLSVLGREKEAQQAYAKARSLGSS